PAGERGLVCHRPPANPNALVLDAFGLPLIPGATYTWRIRNLGVLGYQGGVAPVNHPRLTGLSTAAGTTQVDVVYHFAGAAARDTVTVDVISVQIVGGDRAMA